MHAFLYLQRVNNVINQTQAPNTINLPELMQYLLSRTHRQRIEDSLNAIRCLKHLQANEMEPDMGDRLALLSFAGFGTLRRLFTRQKAPVWEQEARQDLEGLLSKGEFAIARNTMLNAFPTSPEIVQSMWRLVEKLGFQGGRVLDPGCGIGHFLTFCPEELKQNLRYVGVDIDKTTIEMALELHDALGAMFYNRSFFEFLQPAASFDLVIGNVPFEDGTQAGYNGFAAPVALHARFVIKGLEMLKPGGFMVLMTSTGAMDSVGSNQEYRQFREYVDRRAVFVGAVRLPYQSSLAISGTACCADILVLQKRYEEDDRESLRWLGTVDSALMEYRSGNPMKLNEFFQDMPEFLLGTPIPDKTTFGDDFALSWNSEAPFIEALDDAFNAIAEHVQTMTTQVDQTPNQTPTGETTMYAQAITTDAQVDRADWRDFTVTVNTGPRYDGIEFRFPDEPPVAIKRALKDYRFRYKDDNGDKRWWTKQDVDGNRLGWAQGMARQYSSEVEVLAVGTVEGDTPHTSPSTLEPVRAARRQATPVASVEAEDLRRSGWVTLPRTDALEPSQLLVPIPLPAEPTNSTSFDAFLDGLINLASNTIDSYNEEALREQERRAQVQQILAADAEETARKLALPKNSQNTCWVYYQCRTKIGMASVGLAIGATIAAQAETETATATPNPDLVALTRDRSARLPARTPGPNLNQEEEPSLGK